MTPPAATTISDLTLSGGIATLATNALSVAGNLLISGGNLSAGALNVNVAGDWANSVGAGGFITGTGTVTLNGASPTYSTTQTVVISTTTSGATINFTADGSIPSISSTLYTSALAVTPGMTIMAIAVKAGMMNSAVGTTVYMYIPAPVPPVIVTTPPPAHRDGWSLLHLRSQRRRDAGADLQSGDKCGGDADQCEHGFDHVDSHCVRSILYHCSRPKRHSSVCSPIVRHCHRSLAVGNHTRLDG